MWIKRTFQTVNTIIDRLVQDNAKQVNTIVRISLIGYRDVLDKGRFMEFEFTQNINAIKVFLKSFHPTSMEHNVDRPEDVAGALKLSLMQDWTEEAIKRTIIICDAPAHGFYESVYSNQDNYPEGTPDVPSLQALVEEFKEKDIALQVVKLDKCMNKMIGQMQAWWPEIDLIDMTLQKVTDYAARDGGSEYGDSDDSNDSFKERYNEAEKNLKDYFIGQITDATQRQFEERFVDREIERRMSMGGFFN